MFVVVAGKENGSLREPEVLQSMTNFQRYMESSARGGRQYFCGRYLAAGSPSTS
jgi:hypothetical protein